MGELVLLDFSPVPTYYAHHHRRFLSSPPLLQHRSALQDAAAALHRECCCASDRTEHGMHGGYPWPGMKHEIDVTIYVDIIHTVYIIYIYCIHTVSNNSSHIVTYCSLQSGVPHKWVGKKQLTVETCWNLASDLKVQPGDAWFLHHRQMKPAVLASGWFQLEATMPTALFIGQIDPDISGRTIDATWCNNV